MVQLLSNNEVNKAIKRSLEFNLPIWELDDGFRTNVLQLYGVQYIGMNGNGYEYEAVIFNEYRYSTCEVMFILNVLTADVSYEETPIKQFSDTCIHFILSQYYDPSIYEFSIDNLWL